MSKRRWPLRLGWAAVIGATMFTVYWMRPEPLPDVETLAVAQVVRPQETPRGMVFLFSGAQGYTQRDVEAAQEAAASGALVVGIDLAKSFAKVADESDCVYFVSDIEKLSQLIQRSAGVETYLSPIVAGAGAGGSMVMAIAAQSPLATIGQAIAVDPDAALPLGKELCSSAPHRETADGKAWVYGLQAGQLPEPITVIETADAKPDERAHISDLISQGFAIDRVASTDRETQALTVAVDAAVQQAVAPASHSLADLPLALLPAEARHDTMAIVISGDGGWRDIDRELGEALSEAGLPTVGIDSLRYFWTRKSPETIAKDLTRIADHYTERWNVHHVALIGYSFGADVLPAAYNRLSAAEKQRISLVSLLALSRWGEFEFDVSGWLGMGGDKSSPTLPEVAKIPQGIVQCVYGSDDDDSVCGELAHSGAEVIMTDGGHHFDDDYAALAKRIIARIR